MVGRKIGWPCCLVSLSTALAMAVGPVAAESISPPPILQMFEAHWKTIENRMPDIFQVGYGQMWLPPPGRADQSDFSVGYDVYDRFDLGRPRHETLYGTETSLKRLIDVAHTAGLNVYTDLILNHAGFSDLGTVDTKGTATTADDVTFAEAGGYPGLAITLPGDIDGDFHGAFEGGDLNGRLGGLVDIAQEKTHALVRHPVDAGDPNNIPAGVAPAFGRLANVPDPSNARFYRDQDLPPTVLDVDPGPGEFLITRYDFNVGDPMAGDAVPETAEQLLLRHAQWMVQVIGVDGFRIDAAKHFPQNTLTLLDQAVYRAGSRLNHDGSVQPIYSFSEVLEGNRAVVQSYINRGLPNPAAIAPGDFTVKGNRDALDFPLSFALRFHLTDNGYANNWHNIRHASQDNYDNGLIDGSAGVMFVDSHDDQDGPAIQGDGTPFLDKVAYAYVLMRPGNAVVYFNAEEFGSAESRGFPTEGTDDALGGPVAGNAVARLVEIRNSYGRGDFHERWIDDAFNPNGFSNVYIYERENSAIVGLNSRNDDGVETRNGVQTFFAPGTILVELTGNAADPDVDFDDVIPETVRVDATGKVNVSIPANNSPGVPDPVHHGRGYVIYGPATPQGALSLTNVATTLAGGTPTSTTNGTTRQADIDVVHADSFTVRLDTTPVSLPDPDAPGMFVRDVDADGDGALLRIDGGRDLNDLPGVDFASPGQVEYGFEQFTDTNQPGFTNGGVGLYEQQIDATQLAEGRHFVTARAFRHRASGPALFTDFKRTIYVDRLPPEAEVVSFAPFATSPGNPDNRDLIVRSLDGTADNMHIFLDLPAGLSDAQVLQMALNGQNDAGEYDRDQWIYGFFGVTTGNHAATVVTFEPTFDGTHGYNVQRFAGLFADTNVGAGFGDLDSNGAFTVSDLLGLGNNSAEDVLYSQNAKFRASFDVNGDGRNDNRDLFALGDELVAAGAGQAVLDAYVELLLKRGDFDGSTTTDVADLEMLYANFGPATWLFDINVDGVIDAEDAETFVTQIVRTVPGDYNLDGRADGGDYVFWRNRLGQPSLAADGNFDGNVDELDYSVWKSAYGFVRGGFPGGAGSVVVVPEPAMTRLMVTLLAATAFGRNRLRIDRQLGSDRRT